MRPKTFVCRSFISTSNCRCSLFSKKRRIIRIFCTYGWPSVPINPDMAFYCNSYMFF